MAGACVLTGCGHDQGQSPERRIQTGWQRYTQGDFDLAVIEFEGAFSSVPTNSPLRLQALYGLATTWNLRRPDESPERAATLYREIIAAAPTNDLAAWSWLALARMNVTESAADDPDPQALRQAYQEVIDRFPAHPAAEEAFLFQQAARLAAPNMTEAGAVLQALEGSLARHPQSPYRSAAYRLVAQCCDVLGLKDKLLDATIQEWKTSEIDPRNPIQDLSWTYWRIATVAELDVGDFALAREYYRKLIAEYPSEQRVFLAKQELQRMDELEAGLRNQEAVVSGRGESQDGKRGASEGR